MLKIKDKRKFIENIVTIIITIMVIASFVLVVVILNKAISDGMKKSDNYVICKNVQKLYKEDILFDNFYISCNDTTIEIGKELYTRIVENKDYKITYNNMGGIYLVERVKDNE